MRHRPIGSNSKSPARNGRGWWKVVAVLIATAGAGAFAAQSASMAAQDIAPPAASVSSCVSITRAHPGRHAASPELPREALAETERASEDIETGDPSTYSWPAGTHERRLTASSRDSGHSDGSAGSDNARMNAVHLSVLCRLLI